MKLLAQPTKLKELKKLVKAYLPDAETIAEEADNLTIGLPTTTTIHVPEFLRAIERQTSVIREWGLSNSTLEEVFLRLCAKGTCVARLQVRPNNNSCSLAA